MLFRSALAGDREVRRVVVDPSAASFIACIRRGGRFLPAPARNQVLNGIRAVASALQQGRLRFAPSCKGALMEFSQYVWEEGGGEDRPRKEQDHAMDEIRYFVATVMEADAPFFAAAVWRE